MTVEAPVRALHITTFLDVGNNGIRHYFEPVQDQVQRHRPQLAGEGQVNWDNTVLVFTTHTGPP